MFRLKNFLAKVLTSMNALWLCSRYTREFKTSTNKVPALSMLGGFPGQKPPASPDSLIFHWHSQRPVVISRLGGRGRQGIFFMSRCNFLYPRLCNTPIPHHHPQPSHWKLIASQSLLHTALAMTNLPSVPLKTMWSPKILPPVRRYIMTFSLSSLT